MLASVTGGTPLGGDFNRAAARCAARLGLPMATGSLRILFEDPATRPSFDVNGHGELPLFFGNLGVASALGLGGERVREMTDRLRMNGLFLYFNHAHELAQPPREHLRFDLSAVPEFIASYGNPVLIKETGMGFSPADLQIISRWPIAALDTGGAGGSNFYLAECDATADSFQVSREILLQMGIPTASVLIFAKELSFPLIAGGGVRNGLDMARAFALGATLASCAAPLVRAWFRDPVAGLDRWADGLLSQLRMVLSLAGVRRPRDLKPAQPAPGSPEPA
jgi:isopentenyl-diphosphate Delta-isomerase